MTHRWCPPLPTIGRAGPRIEVRENEPLLLKLEEYYLTNRSSPDIFVRNVPPRYIRSLGLEPGGRPARLFEYSGNFVYKFLINNLYVRLSLNFQRKLSKLCLSSAFGTIREWYNTATASVMPLLLCGSEDEREIDLLTSWSMEHCANNYSHFQRLWKKEKKSLRKAFAERKPFRSTCREMSTYTSAFVRHLPANSSDHEMATYVLIWTQTRGTGLADARMIQDSIKKFKETVTIPVTRTPKLELKTLQACCAGSQGVDPRHARISIGPTACLENPRKGDGKTGFVSETLTRTLCLRSIVDFDTLESKVIPARPLQRPSDLLHWGVQQSLNSPIYTRAVRVHAVAEPGKARTITVASLAFQAIQGVIAHLLYPTIKAWQVRSGMKASRHLWNFIHEDLHPLNPVWGEIGSGKVYALSTDLETATDFGNPSVARQIYHQLVVNAVARGAPRGLLNLGKTLYTSKRYILLPRPGEDTYELITNTRGWFMGDMMTKVILTIAHDYCCRLSNLKVYSLVGDDEEALSNDVGQLETQIKNLESLDFRVSIDDTFISDFFMFYCEEGSLIPKKASESNIARLRRGDHVLYVDYPRIRLLLPQILETDNYSYTNTGRTSLLGKEGKWAKINNSHADMYFKYASLYQKFLVPQDADVSCPYLPIEIGGDGSFPSGSHFLSRVVQDKSRIDVREIAYRMRSLMDDKFHHKYVRSDRLDRVVHKHHLYIPKLEELTTLLPEDAVVRPTSDEMKILLGSINLPFLEPGTVTLLRLVRDAYYTELFKGRRPVELKFELDRSFKGAEPGPELEDIDYSDFIDQWLNPGFKFRDHEPYWVRRDLVLDRDPMHIKLFEVNMLDRSSKSIEFEAYKDWLKANLNIVDQSVEDVLKFVLEKKPLPAVVMDRLNMFMESDNYIMSVFDPTKSTVGLVSRDVRLASRMVAKMKRRETELGPLVILVDPVLYLIGRVEELDGRVPGPWERPIPRDLELIVDPGAMMHVDLTEFEDGFPLREDAFDADIEVFRPRAENIYICRLKTIDRRFNLNPFRDLQ